MSIQATIDLYGKCSQEEISVINAWYAVGLGDKSPYTTLQRTISNVTYSSNTTIKACSVTLNNAKLTIEADEVNFNGEFNIYLGSELEIK